jgi:hypothetical protein
MDQRALLVPINSRDDVARASGELGKRRARSQMMYRGFCDAAAFSISVAVI